MLAYHLFLILALGFLAMYSSPKVYTEKIKYVDKLDVPPHTNTVKLYELKDNKEVKSGWISIIPPRTAYTAFKTDSSILFQPYLGSSFRTDVELKNDQFTSKIREAYSCFGGKPQMRIVDQYLLLQKNEIQNQRLIGYYYCKVELKRIYHEPAKYLIFKGGFEQIIFQDKRAAF